MAFSQDFAEEDLAEEDFAEEDLAEEDLAEEGVRCEVPLPVARGITFACMTGPCSVRFRRRAPFGARSRPELVEDRRFRRPCRFKILERDLAWGRMMSNSASLSSFHLDPQPSTSTHDCSVMDATIADCGSGQ